MATGTRARPALLTLTLPLAALLVATACSGGAPAGPATPTDPAPSASDPAAICGATVDVLRVLSDGPDLRDDPPMTTEEVATAFTDYRARLEPPLSAIERQPPPVLQADIGTLTRQARFAIENRDAAAVDTPEFEGAVSRLQSYVVRDCGYAVIHVTATDYAYQGIPPTVAAGIAVVTLANQGTEPHELNVYRIDDTAPQPIAEIVRLPEAQQGTVLDGVGSATANPGSVDTVFLSLTPGRYGVACSEPRGSTPDLGGTGPPHAELGMVAEFTVP